MSPLGEMICRSPAESWQSSKINQLKRESKENWRWLHWEGRQKWWAYLWRECARLAWLRKLCSELQISHTKTMLSLTISERWWERCVWVCVRKRLLVLSLSLTKAIVGSSREMITQTRSVPTKQQFKIAIILISNSARSNWRNCCTVIRLIYWNSMKKWRIEASLKLALQKKWLIWHFLNNRLKNLTEIGLESVKLWLHLMLSIFSQWDIYKKAISFTVLLAISTNYFLGTRVFLEKHNRNGTPMQKVNTILKLLIPLKLLPKESTKQFKIPTKFPNLCLIHLQIVLFNVFKANTSYRFIQFSNKSCWTLWVPDLLWNLSSGIFFP